MSALHVKPKKFSNVYANDQFSGMRNSTLKNVRELFTKNSSSGFEEIFIRQKVDGVSMLLHLSLCKNPPRDCYFLHADMKHHKQNDIKQNAWHPCRNVQKKIVGYFYVHIFTAYGVEQKNQDNLCPHKPLYLPTDVLFQLHREIAGWPNLYKLFESSHDKKRKWIPSFSNNTHEIKFLIFRCELSLPGRGAHAVTTSIVDSWRHANKSDARKEHAVMNARLNFQIFILDCVFGVRPEFIIQMISGFKICTLGKEPVDAFVQNANVASHLFSREEFMQILFTGLNINKLHKSQLHVVQNAYFIEQLIGVEYNVAIRRGYGYLKNGWQMTTKDKETASQDKPETILWYHGPGLTFDETLKSMSMSSRLYGNEQHPVCMSVITVPYIYYHTYKVDNAFYIDKSHIDVAFLRSYSDMVLMLTQHFNAEGAVVSFVRQGPQMKELPCHYKLKDNVVLFNAPFYAADPEQCYQDGDLELPKLVEQRGVCKHLFPQRSNQWPNAHVLCYDKPGHMFNREDRNAIIKAVKNRIQPGEGQTSTNKHDRALNSLAIVSQMGVIHTAQRVFCDPEQVPSTTPFEIDDSKVKYVTDLPPVIVSGNFVNGRPNPVIPTSVHAKQDTQLQRAQMILEEQTEYLHNAATFPFSDCKRILQTVKEATQVFAKKEMKSLDQIFEQSYCKNTFSNIWTTMFIILHMRLMLHMSETDFRARHNFIEIWGHASKVLKQLFCTDIRLRYIADDKSKVSYYIALWPAFKIIWSAVESCTNMDTALDIIKTFKYKPGEPPAPPPPQHIHYQKLFTHNRQVLARDYNCSQVMLTAIDTTLDEQLASYISYLTTDATKQEDFNLFHAEASLVTLTTFDPTRFHTDKMTDKINAAKNKCKVDKDEQMKYYRAPYNFDQYHSNKPNALSIFLTKMNQRYGLGATLHGLLPAYTQICDFDPQLFADLQSLKQHFKIVKTLSELDKNYVDDKQSITESKKRYDLQLELMQMALTEANEIKTSKILAFYKSECNRDCFIPQNQEKNIEEALKKINLSARINLKSVCKVFANWHFGDLGDDARVESKQLM